MDAINWSWVLERVRELADELKPWIGPKKMSNAEREVLVRRMLGELALFVHFAEARKGKNGSEWREERVKRLAETVEEMSGGRIAGEHADRLARLIIYYAEHGAEWVKERIEDLGEKVGVSKKEVWGIVERILSGEDPNVYCLARDCTSDRIVRKFVAPALELIMLKEALDMMSKSKDEELKERIRKETLLWFGEMYATALAGDGSVRPREVELAVGGELSGGAALLRLATLYLLKELLSKELKFDVRTYVERGNLYTIAAYGENAARFMRLLAVSAPSAGGEYLSPKFDQFVEEAKVEVRLDENSIRQTSGGAAADLIISEGGVDVKYNVYLRDRAIELKFQSTDRSRAELAARLLKHAGVNAEVKKVSNRDVWQVEAYTDMLAAGREELRNALAKVVRRAVKKKWVDAGTAERWLKKLEKGRVLMEGWPKFYVGLSGSGGLEISFKSTDPKSIEQVAQRLKEMGLEEERHFSVKMPEGGEAGYVYILKDGLAYAAWLSVHSENKQQRELAADFVKLILRRAEEACGGRKEECPVYEKAEKIVEEGKAWSSLELKKLKFEKEFEVDGKKYKVKIIDGEAVEESRRGKTLLRIKIKVEMSYVEDGHIVRVEREYTITYGRYGKLNEAMGHAYARADAPGGREADAEILAAIIEELTGVKPWIYRRSYGSIEIVCGRKHLDGFMRYKELANDIKNWLEKTSRRRPTH